MLLIFRVLTSTKHDPSFLGSNLKVKSSMYLAIGVVWVPRVVRPSEPVCWKRFNKLESTIDTVCLLLLCRKYYLIKTFLSIGWSISRTCPTCGVVPIPIIVPKDHLIDDLFLSFFTRNGNSPIFTNDNCTGFLCKKLE